MPRQNTSHIDDPAALGLRLRESRHQAVLNLTELARGICSVSYLSHIERGNRSPSLQVIRQLAERLTVSERWLASGNDAETPTASALLLEAEAAMRFDDTETAEQLFSQIAEQTHDDKQAARAHAGLGQLAFRRDNAHDALVKLEAALELDPQLMEDGGFADTLGRVFAQIGETEMAVSLFRRRLAAAAANDDAVERLRFSVLLANALIDTSALAEASQVLADQLTMTDTDDPLYLARLHWSQSRLHSMKQESASAARYARKALEVLEATEFTQYRSRAHHLLAFIEIDAGHPEQALELIGRGRELARRGGTEFDLARFDLEEARALAMTGQLLEAAACANRAAQVLIEHHPIDVGRCYAELAGVIEASGELHRARELYELALEYLEHGPNRPLADTCSKLGALLERLGDREAAFETYKRGSAVNAELEQLAR